MKQVLKHIGFCLIILSIGLSSLAQDPQFSQFYSAKFNIGPSFAGTTEGGRITTIFREQWPQAQNSFITYGIAVDHDIPSHNSGVGIFLLKDYSTGGGLTSTKIGVQYSYVFNINRIWQLRPGLQFNHIQKYLDIENIMFIDQLSYSSTNVQSQAVINYNKLYNYDAAVSLLVYSNKIWFGANIDNIHMMNSSFTGSETLTPLKIESVGGAKLKTIHGRLLYDKEYLYFSYLFKYQNNLKQLDIGVYWEKSPVELGIWYRGIPFFKNQYGIYQNSALIAKVGVNYEYLSIGYSYDYTLGKIQSLTGGAHEVTLVYLFNQVDKLKDRKMRMVPCPKF